MTVEKPKPKQLLRPIKIGTNSLEAREKSRVQGAIGFGFASHWLKNWRESFKRITKRSNGNLVITFDSHLKTALNARELFLTITCANSEKLQMFTDLYVYVCVSAFFLKSKNRPA